MTSDEFNAHLKAYSPYNVWTYSFTEQEVEQICKALDHKDLVTEIRELLKEGNNDTLRN